MPYVLLSNNVVIQTNDGPVTGWTSAPSNVAIGWELAGEVWQKSAALVAAEALIAALATKKTNASQSVSTLRSWATDAATAVAAWDGQTQTQKNATVKTVIDRLGTFMSRFADLTEGNHL